MTTATATAQPTADANGLILEDGDYRLEENTNYSHGCGNIFLMRGRDCVGGVDRVFGTNDLWTASLSRIPPEDDPDSDAFAITKDVSRETAISELWDLRYLAR